MAVWLAIEMVGCLACKMVVCLDVHLAGWKEYELVVMLVLRLVDQWVVEMVAHWGVHWVAHLVSKLVDDLVVRTVVCWVQ